MVDLRPKMVLFYVFLHFWVRPQHSCGPRREKFVPQTNFFWNFFLKKKKILTQKTRWNVGDFAPGISFLKRSRRVPPCFKKTATQSDKNEAATAKREIFRFQKRSKKIFACGGPFLAPSGPYAGKRGLVLLIYLFGLNEVHFFEFCEGLHSIKIKKKII
jgi:hypothetical protein